MKGRTRYRDGAGMPLPSPPKLDDRDARRLITCVSRPDGRSVSVCVSGGEESPGSMEIRCRITSGGGDPRESATESIPPAEALGRRRVRVKGCGKSAPRPWQQGRHGKPHREQDRIGAARRPQNRQSISRRAARVGCRRCRVSGAPEEWPSPCFRARYRTRLTGLVTCYGWRVGGPPRQPPPIALIYQLKSKR